MKRKLCIALSVECAFMNLLMQKCGNVVVLDSNLLLELNCSVCVCVWGGGGMSFFFFCLCFFPVNHFDLSIFTHCIFNAIENNFCIFLFSLILVTLYLQKIFRPCAEECGGTF